jgi:hypothetical protein
VNAAEAAYELGRWQLAATLSHDVIARGLTGVTLAFAHHVAGALARARGDLAAAERHRAAQRDAGGPDPTPPDYHGIEAEAELALSRGAPTPRHVPRTRALRSRRRSVAVCGHGVTGHPRGGGSRRVGARTPGRCRRTRRT